jgi:hypothetical protein
MAQHDYNIANLAGAAFRADLNDALAAIRTNNSGSGQPASKFAYQWYVDSDDHALYIGNSGGTDYIEVGDASLVNLGLKKTRRATAQASTSGTAITFGSIPSWANQITMMLNGVSSSGTSELLVQLGTASGFTTTGYNSNADSCTATASENSTAGFLLENTNNASYLHSGLVEMMRIDGNAWVYTSALKRSYSGGTTVINSYGAGNSGTLASVLTQVRLTTVGGTDTFDAGTVNIVYES